MTPKFAPVCIRGMAGTGRTRLVGARWRRPKLKCTGTGSTTKAVELRGANTGTFLGSLLTTFLGTGVTIAPTPGVIEQISINNFVFAHVLGGGRQSLFLGGVHNTVSDEWVATGRAFTYKSSVWFYEGFL